MSEFEQAVGWVNGVSPVSHRRPWRQVAASPRTVLAQNLRQILNRGKPVYVAFSGGIDSSLLLSVAADVARRDDLPLPIPLTTVFGGDQGTEESDFQQLVIGHLGLQDRWKRVSFRPGDDLVGPWALDFARRYGVCWPLGLGVNFRTMCAALPTGSVLITGDGGDEALGPRRGTAVAAVAARRPLNRELVVAVLRTTAPRPLRRWDSRRFRSHPDNIYSWLRRAAQKSFDDKIIDDELREPISHPRSTEYWARRRAVTVADHNLSFAAQLHGATLEMPLLSPEVTLGLQGAAGFNGWLNRAEIVDRIAGDLLPQKVIQRKTKAYFNNVMLGPSARAVIAEWDGTGLNEDVVDVDALRTEWSRDLPHAGTFALLQQVGLLVTGAR